MDTFKQERSPQSRGQSPPFSPDRLHSAAMIREDKETRLAINKLAKIFREDIDLNNDGHVTWDEFEAFYNKK